MTYRSFRTGLTFGQVRQMMWVDNPDPAKWVYKTRGCVLRYWRKLKMEMWEEYLCQLESAEEREECEKIERLALPPYARRSAIPWDRRFYSTIPTTPF